MTQNIHVTKLVDGFYLLGLPPKNGNEAKLLWKFQIKNGMLVHDHPLSVSLEFILRSGDASFSNTSKYLIMLEWFVKNRRSQVKMII